MVVFLVFILGGILEASLLSANARYNVNVGQIMSSFNLFGLLCFMFLFLLYKIEYIIVENKYLHIDNESLLFITVFLVFSMIYYIILYAAYANNIIKSSTELPLIILAATFGGVILLYTYNPIIWVLGIEIQSFCLYALASFRNSSVLLRTKAGMIYFIYGAIASFCILLGISLFYFYHGTIDIVNIIDDLSGYYINNISLSLIAFGITIKLGMPPIYKWLPSVYSNTHTIIVLFYALVPKIPLLYILYVISKIMLFSSLESFIMGLGFLVGIISVLRSEDLGSFIAYTTIVGNCFFFSLLVIPEHFQIITFLLYLSWYQLGITVFFITCIFNRRCDGTPLINNISDLRLFKSKENANGEVIIALLVWAAQPPFVSFFPKFFIYLNGALTINIFTLAMVLIFSIISSFYLIRIISYIIIFYKENIETYVAPKRSAYKYNNYLKNMKNTEYIEHISHESSKNVKENKLIYSATNRLTNILIILFSHISICVPVLLYFTLSSQNMVLESLLFCFPFLFSHNKKVVRKGNNDRIMALFNSVYNSFDLLKYRTYKTEERYIYLEQYFPKKLISLLYTAENTNEYSFQTVIALCAYIKKLEIRTLIWGDPCFLDELPKCKKIIVTALRRESALSKKERFIIYGIYQGFLRAEKSICFKLGYQISEPDANLNPKILKTVDSYTVVHLKKKHRTFSNIQDSKYYRENVNHRA